MYRDTRIQSLYRTIGIVAFILGLAIIPIALYDYSRGTTKESFLVPVCQKQQCAAISSEAIGTLLDLSYHRSSLVDDIDDNYSAWQGFSTENMCALPTQYLQKFKKDENLLKINEIFSVIGIARIEQVGNNWRVNPGRGVDSIIDSVRKIFDLKFSGTNCFRPYSRHYGIWMLVSLNLSSIAFWFANKRSSKPKTTQG